MKNLKHLLLGLIFALVCNVSFAGHPPPATDPKSDTKNEDFTITKISVAAVTEIKFTYVAPAAIDDLKIQVSNPGQSNYAAFVVNASEKTVCWFEKPALKTDFRIRLSTTTPTKYIKDKPIKIDKVNYRNNKWKYHLYWQG